MGDFYNKKSVMVKQNLDNHLQGKKTKMSRNSQTVFNLANCTVTLCIKWHHSAESIPLFFYYEKKISSISDINIVDFSKGRGTKK